MKNKNKNEDLLRSVLIHAALSFELRTDWRSVLIKATYTRQVGRERRFLVNTIRLDDEAFSRVISVMIKEYRHVT